MTEPDFLRSTRTYYDTVAADYGEKFRGGPPNKTLDRAVLGAFAELVREAGLGPVAELGSGPGEVTAHLASLGLDVFGIDLSPEMVALARKEHPDLRFEQGSMTDLRSRPGLELEDGSLGGVAAVYSIIHIPDERLPELFAGFHRVLAPGGRLLLVFFTGDEKINRTEAFGRAVSVDYWLRPAERVLDALGRAGFAVQAQLLREPDRDEQIPRAMVLAYKPS